MEKAFSLGALTSCLYTIVSFERQHDQIYVRKNLVCHLKSTYYDDFWHICMILCS